MRRAISAAIGASAVFVLMSAAPVFADTIPPAEMLDATPKGGPTPLTVTFNARGLSSNVSYAIDFGDGTVSPLSVNMSSARITHVYRKSGSYVANIVRGGLKKSAQAGSVTIAATDAKGTLIANACLMTAAL